MSDYPLSSREFFGARRITTWLGLKSYNWIVQLLTQGIDSQYYRWHRKKKGGGSRTIDAPSNSLKRLQKRLKDKIYQVLGDTISPISTGFMPGQSIKLNALCHVAGRSIFAVDIKSAFPSTRFTLRRSELGLERRTDLKVLASLMLLNGRLAQGAPTSPLLFNLACRHLDAKLEKLAERTGTTITRYADNIILSSQEKEIPRQLRSALRRIITDQGFEINHKKVAYIRDGNREGIPLRLPGVHIVNGRLKIPNRQLKRFRSRLYHALQDNDWSMVCSTIAYVRFIEGSIPRQLQQMLEKFGRDFF